ncbi:MAG: hypothetical protein ABSF92_13000, partial [Candidatus Acidiferrales bacterium]
MKRILLEVVLASSFAATLAFAQAPTASQPPPSSSNDSSPVLADAPFRNPSLPIAERVDDLVSRMTLEEKVSQMRDHATAIPRLGVPKYDWWNEGLHGVAFAGYA